VAAAVKQKLSISLVDYDTRYPLPGGILQTVAGCQP
jgi:hypothetical protein